LKELQRRRGDVRAGSLAPAFREGLAVLPGWESKPRADEHELGVWLHSRRFKVRRSELDPEKAAALDAAAPGWRGGRLRGRRACLTW
jgi:hypothetical protein